MMNVSRFLRRFRKNERGSIAVECVLMIPMLLWAYLSMYAFFHAYRTHSVNQKIAYTIGDIISRETTPIDDAYMSGARQMLAYLTANDLSNVAIRITSVKYDGNQDLYKRDWSRKKGWEPALSNTDVKNLRSLLPVMPHNERVMVVETFVKYDPPFNTGLSNHEIHNFVFTRPRYAPRVLWSDG